MRTNPRAPRSPGLSADLDAIRRFAWLPVVTIIVAAGVALVIGAATSSPSESRFGVNVLVDALPPLFGPTTVPSPFDYAKLATSDEVVQGVAGQAGVSADQLKPRLHADAQATRPEIDFHVNGDNARGIAHAWLESFGAAVRSQSGALERSITQNYRVQLDTARAGLERDAAAAKAAPDDAVAQQEFAAAQENYVTAARLTQSYDIVATTMKADPVVVTAPYTPSRGTGSAAGRLGAALAIGLLAGIIGAVVLSYISQLRAPVREAPEPIDARPAFRKRSERT